MIWKVNVVVFEFEHFFQKAFICWQKSGKQKVSRCRVPLSPVKIPTWQKRQGSWPVLDCCTPDSLRSSAGTWQATFWCKIGDESAAVPYLAAAVLPGSCCFTWQLLLYLAAAALPGSCCYTWWQLLVYLHCQLWLIVFQDSLYQAGATEYTTLQLLLSLPAASSYCNWQWQLLLNLEAAAVPGGSCNFTRSC